MYREGLVCLDLFDMIITFIERILLKASKASKTIPETEDSPLRNG